MKTVGIRELKNKLSQYLRLVRNGETIIVTDRNEIVAEIRQYDPKEPDEAINEYLHEQERKGKIIRAIRRDSLIDTIVKNKKNATMIPDWHNIYKSSRKDKVE